MLSSPIDGEINNILDLEDMGPLHQGVIKGPLGLGPKPSEASSLDRISKQATSNKSNAPKIKNSGTRTRDVYDFTSKFFFYFPKKMRMFSFPSIV